jgi:hypothetical protein
LGQSDQLDQKDQKLQNCLIFKIYKIKNDEYRVYYFDYSSFYIFQQKFNFLKSNDTEVFDLFDPIDRIDPKRNTALILLVIKDAFSFARKHLFYAITV